MVTQTRAPLPPACKAATRPINGITINLSEIMSLGTRDSGGGWVCIYANLLCDGLQVLSLWLGMLTLADNSLSYTAKRLPQRCSESVFNGNEGCIAHPPFELECPMKRNVESHLYGRRQRESQL